MRHIFVAIISVSFAAIESECGAQVVQFDGGAILRGDASPRPPSNAAPSLPYTPSFQPQPPTLPPQPQLPQFPAGFSSGGNPASATVPSTSSTLPIASKWKSSRDSFLQSRKVNRLLLGENNEIKDKESQHNSPAGIDEAADLKASVAPEQDARNALTQKLTSPSARDADDSELLIAVHKKIWDTYPEMMIPIVVGDTVVRTLIDRIADRHDRLFRAIGVKPPSVRDWYDKIGEALFIVEVLETGSIPKDAYTLFSPAEDLVLDFMQVGVTKLIKAKNHLLYGTDDAPVFSLEPKR